MRQEPERVSMSHKIFYKAAEIHRILLIMVRSVLWFLNDHSFLGHLVSLNTLEGGFMAEPAPYMQIKSRFSDFDYHQSILIVMHAGIVTNQRDLPRKYASLSKGCIP